MALEPGTAAPDLTLKDQDGEEVALSSFRGDKAVALVFYPFSFSGICRTELCELRDDLAWAEAEGYGFPVLSDHWPHGAAAKAYGVFNEAAGCANRATFLIGRDGTIVDSFESGGLGEARPAERYAEALAKL